MLLLIKVKKWAKVFISLKSQFFMNRHAKSVLAQLRKLPCPATQVEIVVETSHGYGLGYGGEPYTGVKYKITDKGYRKIIGGLTSLEDVDQTTINRGISLAQDIARVVGENYNPRGYDKMLREQKERIPVWALTFQRYSTGFFLYRTKKSSIRPKKH